MATPYDHIGLGYSQTRGKDPHLARIIEREPGDARSVISSCPECAMNRV